MVQNYRFAKKLFALLSCACFAVSTLFIAGCGGSSETADKTPASVEDEFRQSQQAISDETRVVNEEDLDEEEIARKMREAGQNALDDLEKALDD